jgi:hypothetical protein
MDDEHRVFRIIYSAEHVLEFKTLQLLIELFQIIGNLLGEILLVGFFRKFDKRSSIFCKRMNLVPGIYPIFSRVDLLQDLLSRDVIVPEVDLMRLRLKFPEL